MAEKFSGGLLKRHITGHSGTGKTLYAESLAKASGHPLFKVGTSDIGLNAPEAERNLRAIFELSEAWNAVLLM
jgi:AAA+ superfamily predicted ATPase